MKYRVPYIDYPAQYEKIRGAVLETVDGVLGRGNVMLRDELRAFEDHLAEFAGVKHAVGTGNCTDALYLALQAAGVGPADEVITVAHTFVATAAAIRQTGANPVLVDVGADHLMDAAAVEAAITPRTKAIVPVHLNGRLCDMEPLLAIARRRQLVVMEDAAQGLGASVAERRAGSFGLAGCFSFYPAKILGAYGDAGAVVTNDHAVAETIRTLRNVGRSQIGEVIAWGSNSRLDNLHAAVLDLKLKLLPGWIGRRREIASRYHQKLANCPGLVLPPPPAYGDHFDVFQNYEIEADDRDALRAHLTEAGIETILPWGGRAIHQFPALGFESVRLPVTERLFERVLLLPMHCELSGEQVDFVADAIQEFSETNINNGTLPCAV